MAGGDIDFVDAVVHLFGILSVLSQDLDHTFDAVERRSDIMGHSG